MHQIEYHNGIALLHLDGWITKWVKETGRLDHDTGIHHRLGGVLKNGMRIWDVGANVGTHTVFYQHCAGDSGRVIAFEPYIAAAYCCQHNVPKAVVVPMALSDSGGVLPLEVNPENPGMTRISQGNGMAVPTLSVRDAIHLYGVPDFIKLDAEGFEPTILRGYFDAVRPDQHCPIYLEVNKESLAYAGSSPDEIGKLLRQNKYSVKTFDAEKWGDTMIDVLATPRR